MAAAIVLSSLHAAHAEDRPSQLCPTSSAAMAKDALLRDAVKVAYPSFPERKANSQIEEPLPCIYPYQAIAYENAVVLITLGQTPGDACHGCGAKLSVVFLRKDKGRLVPVARHRDFGESGSWGDLTSITPVRWGSDDGIVVEGGGTFQGETTSAIQAFVFRNGRARPLGPEEGILLSQSNCEAVETGEPCTDIAGTWKVDPAGRLQITYRGKREDGSTMDMNVVYERQESALVLVSGTPLSF